MNQDSTVFDDITGIATTIAKSAFEMKSHRFLKTENEHLLGVCNVCGCDLKLKVWSPLSHILTHATKEQIEQFPAECWIASKDKPQPK